MMALACSEAEAFFLRSALDTSSADGYHACDVKQFYNQMIVEVSGTAGQTVAVKMIIHRKAIPILALGTK